MLEIIIPLAVAVTVFVVLYPTMRRDAELPGNPSRTAAGLCALGGLALVLGVVTSSSILLGAGAGIAVTAAAFMAFGARIRAR